MSLPEATVAPTSGPPAGAPERLDGAADFTRALLRDTGGYLISLGLLSLGNILLLPLITAYLAPSELGLYSLVEAALTQGLTLSLLGMKFAYLYFYAQSDPAQRRRLLGNALLLILATGSAAGGLLALLFSHAGLMAQFDAAPLPMAWLLIPLLLSGAIQTLLLTELRASRHVGLAGIIAVAQLVLWLLLSAWFVMLEDAGLPGLLGAQAIAQTAACCVGLLLIAPRITVCWDGAQTMRMLRYGLPMMTGLLLRYSLDTILRFVLASLISIEAAGLFLIVSRVTQLFESLLALPLLTAWGGLVHHLVRRPDAARIAGQISSLALGMAATLALLCILLQPELFVLLAHSDLPDAAGLFALLMLSRVVQVTKSPLTAGILISGRTGWSISNNMLALFIFLAAVFPLTRLAGLSGTAGALLLANLLTAATLISAAWRACPLQIAPPAMCLVALLLVAVVGAQVLGPLPVPLGIAALGLAALLGWRLTRHLDVTNRL